MLPCVKYIFCIFISFVFCHNWQRFTWCWFVELCLSSLWFCSNFCAVVLVAVLMVWLILQVTSMKTKWKKAGLSHLSLAASCQLVHDTRGRCALERLWKWLNMASGPLALLKDQIPNHKPFVYLNMCIWDELVAVCNRWPVENSWTDTVSNRSLHCCQALPLRPQTLLRCGYATLRWISVSKTLLVKPCLLGTILESTWNHCWYSPRIGARTCGVNEWGCLSVFDAV